MYWLWNGFLSYGSTQNVMLSDIAVVSRGQLATGFYGYANTKRYYGQLLFLNGSYSTVLQQTSAITMLLYSNVKPPVPAYEFTQCRGYTNSTSFAWTQE